MDLMSRITHWKTTALGAAGAAAVLAVWQGMPSNCVSYISNYHVWGTAAALAAVGALLGPSKPIPPSTTNSTR